MATIATNTQFSASFTGNGDTFKLVQYTGDTFTKVLIASIPTVLGTVVNFNVNDSTGDNTLSVGSEVSIYAVAVSVTGTPTLTQLIANNNDQIALISSMSNVVYATNAQNFAALPNNDGSFIFTAYDRMYQGTVAAGLPVVDRSSDAVAAQINNWDQVQPPVAVSEWTMSQVSSSSRPSMFYNSSIQRQLIGGTARFLTFNRSSGAVPNPGFFELMFAVNWQSGDSLQMFWGTPFASNIMTLSPANLALFGTTFTFSSSAFGSHIFRVRIPLNSSFNGGNTTVWRDNVQVSEAAYVRSSLQTSSQGRLTINGSNMGLGAVMLQTGELTGTFLTNANTAMAHTVGATVS